MRGTGKTKAMVEGLPEAGSIVIVHHGASADYVRRMIRDLRGRHVEAATTVRAVTSRFEADRVLLGVSQPVFTDHAFEDHAGGDLRAYVAELTRRAYARGGMRLEAGEEQLRTEVSCLELRDGDIVVLRSPVRLTHEQAARCQAQIDRLAAKRGLRNVDLLVIDAAAELKVLRPTVGIDWAAQDGPADASAAPVERAA